MKAKHHNHKHGMSHKPLYRIWTSMKQRCLNPNDHAYKNYGGRGIKVCQRWLDFQNFYQDMNNRPYRGTLERIDNNGNYEPSNVRWATYKEQGSNRRNNNLIKFNGTAKVAAEWANIVHISHQTIKTRLRKGWPIEKALLTPVMTSKRNRNALMNN